MALELVEYLIETADSDRERRANVRFMAVLQGQYAKTGGAALDPDPKEDEQPDGTTERPMSRAVEVFLKTSGKHRLDDETRLTVP